MPLHIVPAYAGLLTLLYLGLSYRVVRARYRAAVAIGTGNDPVLERAVRVHANFAEYVPLALVLLGFMEVREFAPWALHALCLALLAGRTVHAVGVSQMQEFLPLRSAGIAATFTVLAIGAGCLIAG